MLSTYINSDNKFIKCCDASYNAPIIVPNFSANYDLYRKRKNGKYNYGVKWIVLNDLGVKWAKNSFGVKNNLRE